MLMQVLPWFQVLQIFVSGGAYELHLKVNLNNFGIQRPNIPKSKLADFPPCKKRGIKKS